MTTIPCDPILETPAVEPGGRAEGPVPAGRSIRACFGRRWVSPELLGRLQAGSVLELDSDACSPVEIFADGRLAGFGTAVVVDVDGPGRAAERRHGDAERGDAEMRRGETWEKRLCIRLDRKAESTGAETK